MHTIQPQTHKRAILIACVVIVVLLGLIGITAYYSFNMVADAVPAQVTPSR